MSRTCVNYEKHCARHPPPFKLRHDDEAGTQVYVRPMKSSNPSATDVPAALADQPPARPQPPPTPIPPILLEGDEPLFPPLSGSVPVPRPAPLLNLGSESLQTEGDLPETYGACDLFLAARDPHWVFAHWDMPPQNPGTGPESRADRQFVLRLHPEKTAPHPVSETRLQPESRHWFIHVPEAGRNYHTELGYYRPDRHWVSLAISNWASTPPNRWSSDTSARFRTLPPNFPHPGIDPALTSRGGGEETCPVGPTRTMPGPDLAETLARLAGIEAESSRSLSSLELGTPPSPP